jgi:hypothetical protein
MSEAEIAKVVQLLDLMLGFFADDSHWARGCYDNGNGGHCLVGALLQSTQVLGFNRHTATGVLIATLAFLEARDSGRRSAV